MTNIAEMPKYQTYKDSTEGWIGDVPEHWDIRKLKHLFYEKKHRPNMSLNCGAISFGKVVTKDDEKILLSTKASYQEVLSGEFLINPLNLNYDLISLRIALSEIDVVVSAGYIVIREKEELQKQYFKYLLHRYDVAYMKLLGSGVRQTISFNHIANSLLVFPPLEEQSLIAAFLDKKTTQIDDAISIKEKQINLLKERKQIIIQQAVTQGLDPNVPMKDSSVDWIGKVPAHWEVKKVKHFGRIRSGDSITNSELLDEGLYEVFGGNGLMGFSNYFNVEGDTIVIGRVGALCGNVRYINEKKWISDNALVLKLVGGLDYQYAQQLLAIADLNKLNSSNAQPLITGTKVLNFSVPIPPVGERSTISQFILEQDKLIETTIGMQQHQIEKLKEYKTTLINSAVTGKIKITPEMVEQ